MTAVAVIVGTDPVEGDGAPPPPSDRRAVDLALRCCDGPLTAYSFDPDDTALRYALAAGADTAERLTPALQHRILHFDLLFIGIGACGGEGDLRAARLARENGALLVVEVIDVERRGAGWRVARDLGRGATEAIVSGGPLALVASETGPRPTYVSAYRRQRVDTDRIVGATRSPATATDGDAAWSPTRPRVRVGNRNPFGLGSAGDRMAAMMTASAATGGDRGHIVAGDGATCARRLVRYLCHFDFLQRPGLRDDGPVTEPRATAPAPASVAAREVEDERIRRGPRPLDGVGAGMARRPTPYTEPCNA